MNIGNEKMSCRQAGRLFFYSFFPLSVLLLPQLLAQTGGMDGFFALVGGNLAGYVFLRITLWLTAHIQKDYVNLLSHLFGRAVTGLVLVVYLLVALYGAAYGLELLCQVIRIYLIRDTPVWLVMGALSVLVVYGLGGGAECRGRRCELLFWFVLVPLVLLLFLAVWNIEPDHWLPVAKVGGRRLAQNSYLVFGCSMAAAYLPVYADAVSHREGLCAALKRSYVFSAVLLVLFFLTLTGIYGAPTVAVMDEAVLELTAMVKVPGGFLERQDALLGGIWFVGMYLFVENALYAAVWSMEKLGNRQMDHWFRAGGGILMYVAALVLYRYRNLDDTLGAVYLKFAVPVLLLTVVVAALLTAWRQKQERRQKKDSGSTGAD